MLPSKTFLFSRLVSSRNYFRKLSSAIGVPELKARREAGVEYSVTEVRIPAIGGIVAGKLWEGKNAASSSSSPILCLHGWLDNAGTFDPLLPLIMKSDMTVLTIDFPGHGLSSHVSQMHYDLHMESMLAMKSVLQHFGWEKCTILGHSLGAIVGFVFAAIFPEQVTRYIALENVRPIPRNLKTEIRYAITKLMELDSRDKASIASPPTYTFDEIIQRFYEGRGGTISLEGCRTLMRRGAILLPNNKYRFAHDVKAAIPTGLWRFSPTHTEELAMNIQCPVCFVKGEPGGDYEARENYTRIVDLMRTRSSRVEFHGVPGTHHFHLNDPHAVAPIITQFLQS